MKTPIRTVLVDDEPPSRERMTTLLRAHPEIEIVGEAWDVESAAELCARERPDLILLDIHMPRGSGFDLLPLLDSTAAVIFVTASDTHAVKAFEVNALDYLLKPIRPDRLALALSRLRLSKQSAEKLVALKEDSGLRLVPMRSISHIQAEDNYTSVQLLDAPPAFVRKSLAAWEKILPADQFLRIDRSLVVRLDAVQSLQSTSRDNASLQISGKDTPILLGRRAALCLKRAMERA